MSKFYNFIFALFLACLTACEKEEVGSIDGSALETATLYYYSFSFETFVPVTRDKLVGGLGCSVEIPAEDPRVLAVIKSIFDADSEPGWPIDVRALILFESGSEVLVGKAGGAQLRPGPIRMLGQDELAEIRSLLNSAVQDAVPSPECSFWR